MRKVEFKPFGKRELLLSSRRGFGQWETTATKTPSGKLRCENGACWHTEEFHYWNPVDNRNECVALGPDGKRCGCGGTWDWSPGGEGLRW